MNASLAKAVYLFAAPLSQAARTIDALKAKKTDDAPAAPAAEAAEEPNPTEAVAPAEATEDVATGGDDA